jgi:ribonuclease/clavin/mitogillin
LHILYRRILIDSSGGENTITEYIELLRNELKKRDCSLQEILISHWHPDHTEGVQHIFKNITKSPIKVSKFRLPNQSDEYDKVTKYEYVTDNHEFETEGATLKLV